MLKPVGNLCQVAMNIIMKKSAAPAADVIINVNYLKVYRPIVVTSLEKRKEGKKKKEKKNSPHRRVTRQGTAVVIK